MAFWPIYFVDRWFHELADIGFFLLSLAYLNAVRGKPTEALHHRWIIPGLVSGALVLIYSSMVCLHYLVAYPRTPNERLTEIVLLDVANVVDLYGGFCLLRTLKEIMLWPTGIPRTSETGDPTVWPPAPEARD